MKYIASGYQYHVYDLGNGRVLKKKRDFYSRFIKNYKVGQRRGFSVLKSTLDSLDKNHESIATTLEIKKRMTPELARLLAHPLFKEGIEYEQDKVIDIENYFATHSIEDNKIIVDKYIELRLKLWSFGIHDIFKLKDNHGVDKNGQVVLLDFNELYFSKKDALESIDKKIWLKINQYKKWGDGELKQYYTREMNSAMTEENLEKHWGVRMLASGDA